MPAKEGLITGAAASAKQKAAEEVPDIIKKIIEERLGTVAHTCNPSTLGG